MEMKLDMAYKWMAWGTFCTAIHLNFGQIQFLPPYVGFAMVALGMYGVWKEAKNNVSLKSEKESARIRRAGRILLPVMILLVLVSLAGTVIETIDVSALPESFNGIASALKGGVSLLLLAVLEFAGYITGLSLMKTCGAKTGIWRAAYFIAEVAGIGMGIYGVLALSPFCLVGMAVAMMTGRMIFFCCVWGESRKAVV